MVSIFFQTKETKPNRNFKMLKSIVILSMAQIAYSCGAGGGGDCGLNDETTYHTFICDNGERNVESNFCFRVRIFQSINTHSNIQLNQRSTYIYVYI